MISLHNQRAVSYCGALLCVALLVGLFFTGCVSSAETSDEIDNATASPPIDDIAWNEELPDAVDKGKAAEQEKQAQLNELKAALNMIEDLRPSLYHGNKSPEYQKYIMLHDTEGESNPQAVIDWWDGNGNLVAAHFVIGKDGAIAQCVPMDKIAHHAGYGDAGHNMIFGVEDESRDDFRGTVPIGDWAPDYGMNSYSIGIELVHVGGAGGYPQAQLEALDALIAYIDAYYGFESKIVDHKAWRTGNSDTSPEFAEYLLNYQTSRNHAGIVTQ